MKTLDFVAIGDTVVDAFIRLKEAEVHCDIDKVGCTISMSFGDKIPYESVEEIHAVGNSANAAVSASRLGLNSALITNVGDDEDGRKSIEVLNKDGVSTDLVTKHPGKKTNYHYVLWYEDDRTILVKHEHYEYKLPVMEEPKWLYLSSLGEGTLDYHNEVVSYLKEHPNVSLAFQPGTFQIRFGKEALKEIYERTNLFFCNVDEAEKILGIDTLGINELLKRMHGFGPKIVVITDGPKGAHAYDGKNIFFQSPYPDPKPPFERTGAGDAFASTVASAIALGKDLQTALSWGAVNSMAVVQEVGAQKGLLTQEKIEEYLKLAPAEFKAKTL
jgi:sugar/nucleoside kinase (ribokinase family)